MSKRIRADTRPRRRNRWPVSTAVGVCAAGSPTRSGDHMSLVNTVRVLRQRVAQLLAQSTYAVSAPPNGRFEVQVVFYHRCGALREDTPGVVYIELLRRLSPQGEVEPLDGRLPQYQPVFMIDTRPLRKKFRGSTTYGMSAASCRPRRLERHHTPNAGRAPRRLPSGLPQSSSRS